MVTGEKNSVHVCIYVYMYPRMLWASSGIDMLLTKPYLGMYLSKSIWSSSLHLLNIEESK